MKFECNYGSMTLLKVLQKLNTLEEDPLLIAWFLRISIQNTIIPIILVHLIIRLSARRKRFSGEREAGGLLKGRFWGWCDYHHILKAQKMWKKKKKECNLNRNWWDKAEQTPWQNYEISGWKGASVESKLAFEGFCNWERERESCWKVSWNYSYQL